MKKVVAFLIAMALCALAHPSVVLPRQKPTPLLPTAKLRRLNKAIAGKYIVVFRIRIPQSFLLNPRKLNDSNLRMYRFDQAAIPTLATLCDEVLLTVLMDRC